MAESLVELILYCLWNSGYRNFARYAGLGCSSSSTYSQESHQVTGARKTKKPLFTISTKYIV